MFEDQWDEVYSKKDMAAYPDNALIRFVAQHYYKVKDRKEVKFLDIGCGVGSSTWYLVREGFSVAAMDRSLVAIERLRQRIEKEKLEALLICSDVTKLTFKPEYFDCIVDVSCLCYVQEEHIKQVMNNIYKVLKPGGRLFSICPTSFSAKVPYNNTIEGVDLKCRFMDWFGVKEQYEKFKVNLKKNTYQLDNQPPVEIWVVDAYKLPH